MLLLLVISVKSSTAQTAPDSPAAPEDLPVEIQDTIVITKHRHSGRKDSADLFLSTDSNTHNIAAWLSSGYVLSSQELRHIPKDTIKAYQAEESFAYANDPAYWQQEKQTAPDNFNFVLWWRIFLFVCGAFLLYGIYRLSRENFSGLFQRRTKAAAAGQMDGMEDETLSEDELDRRLAVAEGARDFRTAVRLLYLKLLRTLEDRQLLPAGRISTNSAWAGVFADPEQAGQFRSLSGAYEYVFYGGFEPDENQFSILRQRFSAFATKIKS